VLGTEAVIIVTSSCSIRITMGLSITGPRALSKILPSVYLWAVIHFVP